MEMMELLTTYTVPLTVALCFMVGYMVKRSESIKNEYIPTIVALVGLVFNIWVNGFSITPIVVVQGLASGLASTGLFELKKNIQKLNTPLAKQQEK